MHEHCAKMICLRVNCKILVASGNQKYPKYPRPKRLIIETDKKVFFNMEYSPYEILPSNLAIKIPDIKALPLPITLPNIDHKESLIKLKIPIWNDCLSNRTKLLEKCTNCLPGILSWLLNPHSIPLWTLHQWK